MSQFDCTACKAQGAIKYGKGGPVCKETGADCLIDRTKREHYQKLSPMAVEVYILFGSCSTQWNYSFGGITGLNYPSVKLVADALEIDFLETRFFRLFQHCEIERLNWLEKERKKKETK